MENDYSLFDRVIAPVIIASREFKIIYANEYAKRSFPYLSTPSGLSVRYSREELNQARNVLQAGETYLLKYSEETRLYLLFKPEISQKDELNCIYVYVASLEHDHKAAFPYLTDGELLSRMRRDVVEPTNLLLKQIKYAEQYVAAGNIDKSLKALQIIEHRMLRTTLFFSRMKDCTPKQEHLCILSDAVNALRSCNQQFPQMKYKPKEPCYISMEKDSQILLYADILTNLICRQDKPSVTVTSEVTDTETVIKFASGPLNKFLDEPCEDDFDGIDMGLFSVRRRVEAAGGEILVKKRNNSGAIVSLHFPKVNLLLAETTLFDPSASYLTDVEISALKYLRLIADKYSM